MMGTGKQNLKSNPVSSKGYSIFQLTSYTGAFSHSTKEQDETSSFEGKFPTLVLHNNFFGKGLLFISKSQLLQS
jgi:hypothetical protein